MGGRNIAVKLRLMLIALFVSCSLCACAAEQLIDNNNVEAILYRDFKINIASVTGGASLYSEMPEMKFRGYFLNDGTLDNVVVSEDVTFSIKYKLRNDRDGKYRWKYSEEYSDFLKGTNVEITEEENNIVVFNIILHSGDIVSKRALENGHIVFDTYESYGIPTLIINLEKDIPRGRWDAKAEWIPGTYALVEGSEKKYDTYSQLGSLKMKGRGSSSWQAGEATGKFPYTIRLDEKKGLAGMPEGEDWVLVANVPDKSLMRNYLTYTLAQGMQFGFAPKCKFVDLYLNNDYEGTYLLCEKIRVDDNKISIIETKPEDLLASDSDDNLSFFLEIESKDRSASGDLVISVPGAGEFNVKSPKKSYFMPDSNFEATENKELEKSIITYMRKAYNSCSAASAKNKRYMDYIDTNSFIDYYILQEFAKNIDGCMALSTFIQKDKGGKLTLSLWDFDLAYGNCNYGTESPSGFYIRGSNWFKSLFRDPDFKEAVAKRYSELRQGLLSEENIYKIIDEAVGEIKNAANHNFEEIKYLYGAVDENMRNNPIPAGTRIIDAYVWPNTLRISRLNSFESQNEYLKDWIQKRLDWLDKNIDK